MREILKGNIIDTPALGQLRVREQGYLLLENGRIRGVCDSVPEDWADAAVHDYGDGLIMQSFADMHLHGPQYPMLGMGMDLPLMDWLDTYTFPVEAR